MSITKQIAKQFREVYFGGNWTASNLKEHFQDITWQQANTKIYSFNTITTLVYHINYYVTVTMKVLRGETLNAKDEYSFNHPPITSQEDWEGMLDKVWKDAEDFAKLIEQMEESKLLEIFVDKKYGTYYRNLHGIIEHCHYHLGQIVMIKKLLLLANENSNNNKT